MVAQGDQWRMDVSDISDAGQDNALVDENPLADVRIDSHGSAMNAVLYTAGGASPHPAVVLFHGFPGNARQCERFAYREDGRSAEGHPFGAGWRGVGQAHALQ